VQQTLAQTFHA